MITPADYAEWCRYAGLYLGHHSHAHRYKAYEEKVSRAGVYVRVVDDFLQDNQGGIDVPSWRSYSVYEMADDADYRLRLTADALAAVGARRAAAKVRVAEDTSTFGRLMQHAGDFEAFMKSAQESGGAAGLMDELRKSIGRAMPDEAAKMGLPVPGSEPVPVDADCETWEEIEHLLSKYVRSHQTELKHDFAKHGDPRQDPGFDPESRLAELEAIHSTDVEAEFEHEQAEELLGHLREFESATRGTGKRKPKSWRQPILTIYRRHSGKSADQLTPPMKQALAECRRVMEQFPDIFTPPAIDDAKLRDRLADIGEYDVDPDGQQICVTWNNPAALNGELGQFALRLRFRNGDKEHLTALLDAVDRLFARFPQHVEEIRAGLLESFEIFASSPMAWGLEDYEHDADGRYTPASIFAHISPGTITVEYPEWDPEYITIELFMGIDWDDEHGFEMSFVDEQN